MSFIRNQAVTGFTFGLVNKSTGAALTGVASAIGKYVTKDGGTRASISGAAAYTRRGASQSVHEQEVAEWQSDRDAALRYVEWYRQRPDRVRIRR